MLAGKDAQRDSARIKIRCELLERRLVDELVPPGSSHAGFAWWTPSSDWRRDALIADYLIQSVSGVSAALVAARYSVARHSAAAYSQAFHVKGLLSKGVTRDQFLDYMNTPEAVSRDLEMRTAVEATYYHSGQALDRVAAVLAVVGAFSLNVQKVGWTDLEGTRRNLVDPTVKKDPKELADEGTDLRKLQEALLDAMVPNEGPPGWLEWLRDARNGTTHRAPSLSLRFIPKGGGLTTLLYRNPGWSDLQSLAYSGKDLQRGAPGTFLLSDPSEVMKGLVGSTEKLALKVLDATDACWDARKSLGLTTQPVRQWPTVTPPDEISFAGFGADAIKLRDANEMYLNTDTNRRYEAARVTDNRVMEWHIEQAP